MNMTADHKKTITILCPVYNEEATIPLFHDRLMKAIAGLREKYNFTILFTNNASEDRSLDVISGLREKDPDVQVLTLSRNFGYQASLMAGLENSSGEATVIIDVDCEDPPEMIPRFVEEWEKGCDIAYGRRDKRPEPVFLQLVRKMFYRITKVIADNDFILDMAEFSLITARVREAVLRHRSTFPFFRGEFAFVGFRRVGIPYSREPRIAGKTHYNYFTLVKFAIAGILSASTFPLRLAMYLGLPLFLINLVAFSYLLLLNLDANIQWLFLLDLSYIILVMPFLGTYLARTYKDVTRRPVYIIDWENSCFGPAGPVRPIPDGAQMQGRRD